MPLPTDLSTAMGANYQTGGNLDYLLGPATRHIKALAAKQAGRAVEQSAITGGMRGGGLQSRLGEIDSAEQYATEDLITSMLAQKAVIDEQKRQEEANRIRLEEAYKKNEEAQKKVNEGQMAGGGLGAALAAALAIPTGGLSLAALPAMATPAMIGYGAGQSIGGNIAKMGTGGPADLSTIGNIGTNLAAQEAEKKREEEMNRLYKYLFPDAFENKDLNIDAETLRQPKPNEKSAAWDYLRGGF